MMTRGGIAALLFSCAVGCHDETSSANVDVPGSLNATFDLLVSAPLGSAPEEIQISAHFRSGADYVIFDQGETLSLNEVVMTRDGKDFRASIPLSDEPESYAFRLDVPGKGSFTTNVTFALPAVLTSPLDGAVVRADDDLTVAWSEMDPQNTDELTLTFRLNDGIGNHPTIRIDPVGTTSIVVSGSDIRNAYDAAAVNPGAPVTALIDLGRFGSYRFDDPAPYEGISVSSNRTLGVATITVTP